MKSLGWLAAGVAAIATAGFGAPAFAWPTSAYTSNMIDANRNQCLNRATEALAAEGWSMRPSGGLGVLGHKEPSSAYILCLEANGGPVPPGYAGTTTDVVIFVTSTSGDVALPVNEAGRLQQRMLQPAATAR